MIISKICSLHYKSLVDQTWDRLNSEQHITATDDGLLSKTAMHVFLMIINKRQTDWLHGEVRITHSAVPCGKWQGNGAGESPFCSHGSLGPPNSHQWIGNLGGKVGWWERRHFYCLKVLLQRLFLINHEGENTTWTVVCCICSLVHWIVGQVQ